MTAPDKLTVYPLLLQVAVTGYESLFADGGGFGMCEGFYGMDDNINEGVPPRGIIWSSHYDKDHFANNPVNPDFTILVSASEYVTLAPLAQSKGFTLAEPVVIIAPQRLGDSTNPCEILKHRGGWVVLL